MKKISSFLKTFDPLFRELIIPVCIMILVSDKLGWGLGAMFAIVISDFYELRNNIRNETQIIYNGPSKAEIDRSVQRIVERNYYSNSAQTDKV